MALPIQAKTPSPIPPKPQKPLLSSVPPTHGGGAFQTFFRFMKILALGLVLLWGGAILPALLAFAYNQYYGWPNRWSESQKFVQKVNVQTYFNAPRNAACNVLANSLTGFMETYALPEETALDGSIISDVSASDYIVSAIEAGEEDPTIKAHLLEVDSGGGYPVAGEEIAKALRAAKKPSVVVIRQIGASAAYMAAAAGDYIFASRYADIGAIGLTASYVDQSKKNDEEGLTYNQLTTGKYKDLFSQDKPLTDQERAIIERDLKIGLEIFIQDVAKDRRLDVEKVRALADGSTLLGDAAKEQGLIDAIGGLPEAKKYLAKKIGEDVEVCW